MMGVIHVGHEAVDDRLEGEGDDQADGDLDQVSLHDEVFELFDHRGMLLAWGVTPGPGGRRCCAT